MGLELVLMTLCKKCLTDFSETDQISSNVTSKCTKNWSQ